MKKWIVWLLVFSATFVCAQEKSIVDSLTHLIHQSKEDTNKAILLYRLSKAYWDNNTDSALLLTNQILKLSEDIGYEKGIANAYNGLGVIYDTKGDLSQSMIYYKKSLEIRQTINDPKDISISYLNIGNIYNQLGNYPEALNNYFTALKIKEQINDLEGLAMTYNNIGVIYKNQGNSNEALINYFKTLQIEQKLEDMVGISICYNNIGLLYYEKGEDNKALAYFEASLKLKEKAANKFGMITSLENIANIYRNKQQYNQALRLNLRALAIANEIGNKNGVSIAYRNIGNIYTKQKKYKEAEIYLNKSLSLALEMGVLGLKNEIYQALVDLYTEQNDFKKAFDYHKQYIATKDSLLNNENTKKTLQIQLQYDFDKKEIEALANQEKKNAVQQLTRNILIAGITIVFIFALLFLRQRNKIAKGKKESDVLLLNILPAEIAEELKSTGKAQARQYNHVTVLFTDFVNFKGLSEQMSPTELVAEIHKNFTAFDAIMEKHGIEKIKTIGDAYLAVCGLPNEVSDHAQRITKAALEIQEFMKSNDGKFQIRIGIHSGPVVAGIVGVKKFAYDIWGDTVNTAARMEQSSEAGKINISQATYELLTNTERSRSVDFEFEYRGKINAKNKGYVDMWFISRSFNAG